MVLKKIDGTNSAQYVKFRYKAKGQLIVKKQGLAVFSKNSLLDVKKGEKFLVIFNSKNPEEAVIVNIQLEGKLGNTYDNYSIDKLIDEGYISAFDY